MARIALFKQKCHAVLDEKGKKIILIDDARTEVSPGDTMEGSFGEFDDTSVVLKAQEVSLYNDGQKALMLKFLSPLDDELMEKEKREKDPDEKENLKKEIQEDLISKQREIELKYIV